MVLATSLSSLRSALEGVRLPLDLPDSAAAASTSRQIVAQLDDYILPRLRCSLSSVGRQERASRRWSTP